LRKGLLEKKEKKGLLGAPDRAYSSAAANHKQFAQVYRFPEACSAGPALQTTAQLTVQLHAAS